MKIFSCDYCGCVLDADKIPWPPPFEAEIGQILGYKWNGEDYIPLGLCPCCDHAIEKPE